MMPYYLPGVAAGRTPKIIEMNQSVQSHKSGSARRPLGGCEP